MQLGKTALYKAHCPSRMKQLGLGGGFSLPPVIRQVDQAELRWMDTIHSSHLSSPNPSPEPPVKLLAPHWHLQRIKWILRDVIGIELIHLSHNSVAIRLLRFRE